MSQRVFRSFRCISFEDSDHYLEADMEVICWRSNAHIAYIVISTIFIVFFLMGVPLALLLELWRHRAHLHDVTSPKHALVKDRLSFVYEEFEPNMWFFCVCIIVVKCFLAGALCIIAPRSPLQLFIGLLICATFFTIVVRVSPYVEDSHDLLSCATYLSLTLTMLVGALKSVHEDAVVVSRDGGGNGWYNLDPGTLGSILIAINCVPIVFVIVDVVRWAVCLGKGRKKEDTRVSVTTKKTPVDPVASVVSSSSSVVQITPFVPPPPPPPTTTSEEHIEALMKESEEHERGRLKEEGIRRDRSHRRTMARVKVRAKLKQSKRMKQTELFRELDEGAISRVVDAMKLEIFKPGDTIVQEGSTGDNSFYVIMEGTCSVKKHGHTVGRLSKLQHFGESSLVTVMQEKQQPRNATVVSEGQVQALSMNANTLLLLIEEGTVDRDQIMRGVDAIQKRRDAKEHWGMAQRLSKSARSLFS